MEKRTGLSKMIRHLTMPLATKKHFIKSLSLLDTDLQDFKTKFKKSQNTINEDNSADKPKAKIGKHLSYG